METKVREYKSQRAYETDAKHWAKQGFAVANVTSKQNKSGCIRLMLGGFLFRKKNTILVTYQKQ